MATRKKHNWRKGYDALSEQGKAMYKEGHLEYMRLLREMGMKVENDEIENFLLNEV